MTCDCDFTGCFIECIGLMALIAGGNFHNLSLSLRGRSQVLFNSSSEPNNFDLACIKTDFLSI
jgi:hypothetical protein